MTKDLLGFAQHLADLSGPIIAGYFQGGSDAVFKADNTPVTEADSAAEAAMRAEILSVFPEHGILGEEGGADRADAEYVWLLDPIDGTASFMAGLPTFATLIGLLHNGEAIIGVMNQPVIGHRFSAQANHAAYAHGEPMATRSCSSLSEALIATTSPHLFSESGKRKFEAVRSRCRQSIYGTDCYGYAMLASGRIDLVIESGLKPHDILPLKPIIEAAGGIITDWKGDPLGMAESYDVLVAGCAPVHAEALHLLQEA